MQRLFSAGIIIYYAPSIRSNKSSTQDDWKKREYLLLHYEAGHWDFPKGNIEKGETKEQAALRELEEETGLIAKIVPGFEQTCAYWFKGYQKGELTHKTVYFFVGRVRKKRIILSDEHIGYTWMPYKEALAQLTYKNAKQVLAAAESFLSEKG